MADAWPPGRPVRWLVATKIAAAAAIVIGVSTGTGGVWVAAVAAATATWGFYWGRFWEGEVAAG